MIWTLLLWMANGMLALLWLAVDHLPVVLLVPIVGYVVLQSPENQRVWTFGVGILAIAAGVAVPVPVAILLLMIAVAGHLAVRLEKVNPWNVHWTLVRGMGLYSLVGLGYAAYRFWLEPVVAADPALAQGQTYLSVIAAIALYLFPLGVLALFAQGLFVHPPVQGEADKIIYHLRSRGKP